MRNNSVSQATSGEQVFGPDRIAGHEMGSKYARVHVISLAVAEFKHEWHKCDPYLAATATGAQVAQSEEVRHHQAAQEAVQFETLARQMDPTYAAAQSAPQDVVDDPRAQQPQVQAPQVEQQRV
ncbi:MAG TPA: hypothetical protein VF466_04515 [Candidatus Saccharimonadales bacterium]